MISSWLFFAIFIFKIHYNLKYKQLNIEIETVEQKKKHTDDNKYICWIKFDFTAKN